MRLDRQGQGIGRSLLERAVADARRRGLAAVTLTTFRAVTWNAPFYRKFGFRILEDAEIDGRLASLLGDEAEHGIALDQRCAMRLDLR